MLRSAGKVGVTEDVAGTIDAGSLAVPHAEHAIELAFAAQLGLLRAPHGSSSKIFVDAALETDIALIQECRGALKLTIETAERRTAISRDEARGIETVAAVEFLLGQAEPNQ